MEKKKDYRCASYKEEYGRIAGSGRGTLLAAGEKEETLWSRLYKNFRMHGPFSSAFQILPFKCSKDVQVNRRFDKALRPSPAAKQAAA